MQYHTVLFDLDGTVTNPAVSITKSVQYALEAMGIAVHDRSSLLRFIGPPLTESFMEFYGMSAEEAAFAVVKYRERYASVGIRETEVYDGMAAFLSALCAGGLTLAVATSKPEIYSRKILDDLGLSQYFAVITGSELSGERSQKAEVIAETLRRLHLDSANGVVMVGDRKHDIIGAKSCAMRSVGVRWGFAPAGELETSGVDVICDSLAALQAYLLQ